MHHYAKAQCLNLEYTLICSWSASVGRILYFSSMDVVADVPATTSGTSGLGFERPKIPCISLHTHQLVYTRFSFLHFRTTAAGMGLRQPACITPPCTCVQEKVSSQDQHPTTCSQFLQPCNDNGTAGVPACPGNYVARLVELCRCQATTFSNCKVIIHSSMFSSPQQFKLRQNNRLGKAGRVSRHCLDDRSVVWQREEDRQVEVFHFLWQFEFKQFTPPYTTTTLLLRDNMIDHYGDKQGTLHEVHGGVPAVRDRGAAQGRKVGWNAVENTRPTTHDPHTPANPAPRNSRGTVGVNTAIDHILQLQSQPIAV